MYICTSMYTKRESGIYIPGPNSENCEILLDIVTTEKCTEEKQETRVT